MYARASNSLHRGCAPEMHEVKDIIDKTEISDSCQIRIKEGRLTAITQPTLYAYSINEKTEIFRKFYAAMEQKLGQCYLGLSDMKNRMMYMSQEIVNSDRKLTKKEFSDYVLALEGSADRHDKQVDEFNRESLEAVDIVKEMLETSAKITEGKTKHEFTSAYALKKIDEHMNSINEDLENLKARNNNELLGLKKCDGEIVRGVEKRLMECSKAIEEEKSKEKEYNKKLCPIVVELKSMAHIMKKIRMTV